MDKQITLQPERIAARATAPIKNDRSGSAVFEKMLNEYNERNSTAISTASPDKLILVGEISKEKTTVSELLLQHDELKKSGWNILSSAENRNRNYNSLQPGTSIYYNRESGALSWSANEQSALPAKNPNRPAPIELQLTDVGGQAPVSLPDRSPLQELGVISTSRPTVSHLLKAEQSLGSQTWNILEVEPNPSKDFSSLPLGTKVLYNRETREITWQLPGEKMVANTAVAGASAQNSPVAQTPPTVSIDPVEGERVAVPDPNQQILLGKIDASNNTVSHLLMNHPQFKDQTWQLLNNSVNINKSFNRIPAGAEVFIQPGSGEIKWTGGEQTHSATPVLAATLMKKVHLQHEFTEYQMPAADLIEAVQPFIGKSYKDIDCYELLVNGLRRMDIPYEGKDGLFTKLTAMAKEKGLPLNAYLNGEGIVKAAGSLVLSKSYPRMGNWKDDATTLIREMEPLLDKGQILSFSTEKRGHTGIVSQQNDQWTFINSGRLDNSLTENNVSRGVGEEILQDEIRNWFRSAHTNGESLSVTLGQLEQGKILTAYNMTSKFSQQI